MGPQRAGPHEHSPRKVEEYKVVCGLRIHGVAPVACPDLFQIQRSFPPDELALVPCNVTTYAVGAGFHECSDHEITSSARAKSDCGIVTLRAFAVLRLIASSNFVG